MWQYSFAGAVITIIIGSLSTYNSISFSLGLENTRVAYKVVINAQLSTLIKKEHNST